MTMDAERIIDAIRRVGDRIKEAESELDTLRDFRVSLVRAAREAGLSDRDIADILGMTRARVHQIRCSKPHNQGRTSSAQQ